MIHVAVVMGGYSDEYVISLKSGQLIMDRLDREKYIPTAVHILPQGWYAVIGTQKYAIDRANFSFVQEAKKIHFDVAVNTVHGTPGEDGHLQAYWSLIGLPYTGCSFYQSALTFNKRDTLSVLSKFGIPKAESVYLTKTDAVEPQLLGEKLGLPFFVKPNQSGSSLGVTMVKDLGQLDQALEAAFAQDDDILVESYLKGTEVSVGVLKFNGNTRVLGLTEIVSHNDFFDYQAKYEGKSDEITPARIDAETEARVRETAAKVYDSLGMTGFSRSDFIVMDGIPYFIEINTNPGLSPQSIFPQQAAYANIAFADLLDNEIALAFNRKTWKK